MAKAPISLWAGGEGCNAAVEVDSVNLTDQEWWDLADYLKNIPSVRASIGNDSNVTMGVTKSVIEVVTRP